MKTNSLVSRLVIPLVFLALSISERPVIAQITVTKSHFEDIFKVGSRMHVRGTDGPLPVNVGKKGGPNIYDFTSLSLSYLGHPFIYRVPDVPSLAPRYDAAGFSFGESPTELHDNAVLLFRGDTLLMIGVVEISAASQLVQHLLPPPILTIFPGVLGRTWSQSYEHRETTYVGSQVIKTDSRITNQTFHFDGYGTLRLPGRDIPCLRLVARDQPGGTADLTFHYLTQEGYWFEVRCSSSEPDTGIVTAQATRLLMRESLVDVSREDVVPADFTLHQNYPNPFNPVTRLEFSLARRGRAMLRVLDLFGREVRLLFDGEAAAGTMHRVDFDGTGLASGIYFVRLEAGEKIASRKIMLLK